MEQPIFPCHLLPIHAPDAYYGTAMLVMMGTAVGKAFHVTRIAHTKCGGMHTNLALWACLVFDYSTYEQRSMAVNAVLRPYRTSQRVCLQENTTYQSSREVAHDLPVVRVNSEEGFYEEHVRTKDENEFWRKMFVGREITYKKKEANHHISTPFGALITEAHPRFMTEKRLEKEPHLGRMLFAVAEHSEEPRSFDSHGGWRVLSEYLMLMGKEKIRLIDWHNECKAYALEAHKRINAKGGNYAIMLGNYLSKIAGILAVIDTFTIAEMPIIRSHHLAGAVELIEYYWQSHQWLIAQEKARKLAFEQSSK